MPEIFADQHPHAAKTRVKRAHRIAPGKETALIEQTICGQVDFMMDVQGAPAGEIGRGNIKTVPGILIDEPDHQIQILACLEQRLEDGVFFYRPVRYGGHKILENISRQGKLGKDEQIGFFPLGLFDQLEMLLEVGLDVTKFRDDLCNGKF